MQCINKLRNLIRPLSAAPGLAVFVVGYVAILRLAIFCWLVLRAIPGRESAASIEQPSDFLPELACHAILLLLGYLGLYTVPVAITITLPLVAFAYRDNARSNRQDWLFGLTSLTALAAAVALLLVAAVFTLARVAIADWQPLHLYSRHWRLSAEWRVGRF